MAASAPPRSARALQRDQGIVISGIVMLSPLLEGWLTFGDDKSALHAALQLPSLAAAELERKHAFTPDALAAAEKFAMTDYLVTLAGAPPKGEAANAFYERVAANDRPAAGRSDAGARLCRQRLREEPAVRRRTRSSAAMTRPSRSTTPIPSGARRAHRIRSSTPFRAPMAAPWPPTRATSSASRPR